MIVQTHEIRGRSPQTLAKQARDRGEPLIIQVSQGHPVSEELMQLAHEVTQGNRVFKSRDGKANQR